jgi:hypothetical protein
VIAQCAAFQRSDHGLVSSALSGTSITNLKIVSCTRSTVVHGVRCTIVLDSERNSTCTRYSTRVLEYFVQPTAAATARISVLDLSYALVVSRES